MSSPDLSENVHIRRIRLLLWFAAGLTALLGGSWAVFFGWRGDVNIFLVDLSLLALGGLVGWLTHKRRTRLAFLVMLGVAYLVIVGMSLFFDVPREDAPRTSHLYLLVMMMACTLVLRGESRWLRWGAPAVLGVTFIVFASTTWGFESEYLIATSVRRYGGWVHGGIAVIGLMALVHIMLTDVAEANWLELELRKGLTRKEFFLVYQPQVRADGAVVGAEALIRWKHPKLGLVPPGQFITVAEDTGLILPIGEWVLQTACATLSTWANTPALAGLTLSVNVSAKQFLQPSFVQQVADVLAANRVPPDRLKVELTESMLVHDMNDIVQKMHLLHSLGVGCSLDDFGTGFSSLSYLKKLPLDQLKIDQSFVRDVLTDPSDAAIARTVLQLGESLGFSVIAEGVETAGQRDFLLAHRCELFQGYLFSRPLSLADFETYVSHL